ncbi:MAG: NAD-dependent epimerase/dehydratase family protein [Alphaproteobacteria bacterium]
MTTLIVGAGLVGVQVARILVERGERPVLMDHAPQPRALGEIFDLARAELVVGDILRPLMLADVMRKHDIARVVHTAANPMLTLGAQRDPFAAIQLNIMGTVNVIEAARVQGIKRVVVSSSNVLNHFLVGGDGSGDEMREDGFPRPSTFYAATKQSIESLGLNYARWCGIEFAAMRYGAVFGPWSGQGGGGPSNVMRTAVQAALDGGEAVLPAGAMEWVYSKDAATGTVQALDAATLGLGVFNITMGSLSSPEDTAKALQSVVPGAKVRIETPKAAAVSLPDMKRVSDLSVAKRVLGFAPKFRLADGIRDLAEWLKARKRG